MTVLPIDFNGYPILALSPRETISATLSDLGAEVLTADANRVRIIRLLTASTDVRVGVGGEGMVAEMPLMSGVAEHIKLEAGMRLYASGSGVLHVTVMG